MREQSYSLEENNLMVCVYICTQAHVYMCSMKGHVFLFLGTNSF